MTKAELIKLAISNGYFKKEGVEIMFATNDGHFFYEANKNYAISHVNGRDNAEFFEITKADVTGKSAVVKEVEEVKEEVVVEAISSDSSENKEASFKPKHKPKRKK